MIFPTIKARDLDGTDYVLPRDLPAGPRLVLIAFKRWHQDIIERWRPHLDQMVADTPSLSVWEVPALSSMYGMARPFIDGGMSAGIPDPQVRQHTLTVYTELGEFATALGLESFDSVHLLLLDVAGEVVWHADDEPTAEKRASLHEAVAHVAAGM